MKKFSAPRIVALDSLALIAVDGDDAREFLQGQFSNDVAAAKSLRAQLHAYCNPKGRALAVLWLAPHANGFWLIVPGEIADGFIARLKMFVLRAKVNIARSPLGIFGAINAGEINCDGVAHVLLESFAAGGDGDGEITSRQFLIGARDKLNALEHTRDDSVWKVLDIIEGLPQVYSATAGQFIPQTINLDLTGGVSFTKGCYPGQEIVARLRHRGKVKHRMLAAKLSANLAEEISPGATIFAADGETKAGQVVAAAETNGECFISASVSVSMAEDELRLQPGGETLTRIALPYSIAE